MPPASPAAARAENAWLRSYPFWDGYFATVLIATIVVVSFDTGAPAAKAAAIALLLLQAAAYVVVGRSAVRSEEVPTRQAWQYAAITVVLFTSADVLASAAAFALSALVAQLFMSLRTHQAIALLALLFLTPAINLFRLTGMDPLVATVTAITILSSSALLGTFIQRLAVQNTGRARLIAELDRTRADLAEVSKEAGVLAERERLAGDIHDTLAQGFAGIITLLQAAEAQHGTSRYLSLALQTAKENLAETRALISALSPPALRDASLDQALRRLADGFEPPAEVNVTGTPAPLAATTEVVLLRAAQEGLTNVRKHAAARTVRLTLHYAHDTVRLTVTDDGAGLSSNGDGYGLGVMRRRVEQAGGTMRLESTPGQTMLSVEVPCSA
ncbi:sensor histidine kinase [Nonomuraea sp. NPDC049152]|uniref:sensor histidine kinase n=1 Tax=Nonomuraea sp. NPDC049152 TaxID=3154350 RepID=UPI0033F4975B